MALWTKTKNRETHKKKSVVREWTDAIVFAVIAATFIRWIFLEAFTIPTPSMERSLLVGDFLFVSKIHYGPRTPKTPLQIPLTHQKIWGTDIPSFSNAIQLPSYRLPGLSEVKRNDVVVFNYMNEDYPTDLKTNYIKRCIGVSGDSLAVRNKVAYVNGKPAELPEELQTAHALVTNQLMSEKTLRKYKLFYQYQKSGGSVHQNGNSYTYTFNLTKKTTEQLRKLPFVVKVEELSRPKGRAEHNIFPSASLNWNADWYGPVYIPAKGDKMPVNAEMLTIYGRTIKKFEGHKNVEIKEGKLLIGGKQVDEYEFRQNYYFMMGDNRDNSLDSRYEGFVPADHIVGKALFIWMSIDPYASSIADKIRWNRLFNIIH
ncbi:MAG: signal peptidase I [Cytophagales bacterium]|nr:signal peptidase I [Cytophagales bacterium]